MTAHRSALPAFVLLSLGLVPAFGHAQTMICEMDTVQAEQTTFTKFYAYRSGVKGEDLRYRDVEFLWDSLYAGGLTTDVERTLDRFAGALVDSIGWNPFGIPVPNFNLVYDYFRRGGSFYTQNPFDTTSVVIGWANTTGGPPDSYNPSDRSHADVYLFNPSRGLSRGGAYVTGFVSDEEDVSTGHAPGQVKHANAFDLKGPTGSQMIDLDGTGWTHPQSFQALGFNHEFQHSLPPGQGQRLVTEMFSAGAEAIGGHSNAVPTHDFPYTWSLIGFGNEGGQSGCAGLRGTGSAYQTRSAFMAYLAYNFRGAETSPTLMGTNDDLMRRWNRNTRTLAGLRELMGNDSCGTCATRDYFHADGQPLDKASRLALLLHNWRVANYVNNDTLDEDQYGFGGFGFSPGNQLKAWQAVDACDTNDVVAIPPEVTLTSRFLTRDTTLAGHRHGALLSYPMVLQPYGSEYWVIRSDPSIWTPGQDLVLRVSADGVARDSTWSFCQIKIAVDDLDGRLVASVVAYDRQDESPGVPGELWAHPEWAVRALAPRWQDADSLAGDLEFVVPSFGDSVKAVLLVISLADGPRQALANRDGSDRYKELLKYRVHLGIRASPFASTNPAPFQYSSTIHEDQASWAPTSDSLVYVETPVSGGNPKLYMRAVEGGARVQIAASSQVQSHPEWSPRGDKILFSQTRLHDPYEDLYVLDRPSGQSTLLTTGLNGAETCGTFRADGQRIAYVLHRADSLDILQDWEVRLIGLDGTGDSLLVRRGPGANICSPRWTPDGRWIYFTANDSLYAVGAEGATRGQVIERSDLLGSVTSFDLPVAGNRVAIEEPGDASYPVICTIPAPDTTQAVAHGFRRLAVRDTLRQLTDPRFYVTGASFSNPRLSPDGRFVAYTSDQYDAGVAKDLFVGQISYNHPPAFDTVPADVTVTTCGPVTIDLDATDPDGEAVTYHGAMLPAGASVNPTTGVFTWDVPLSGDTYVVLRAADGSGGVAQRVVKISVPDAIRPAATQITGVFASSNSIGLEWISVGDDSLTGNACKYEIRRHSSTITEANWHLATAVANTLTPQAPGNSELIEVTGLQPDTWYWFAIKTRDEAGDHLAAISNVVSAKTTSGGGGLGASARRAWDEDGARGDVATAGETRGDPGGAPAAAGSAATADGASMERTAESTSLTGSDAAIAAEFTRSEGVLSWRVYRLDDAQATALGGRGSSTGLLLQRPAGDGWQTRSSFTPGAACSVLALMPPDGARGRVVLVGGHDLALVNAGSVTGGAEYAVVSASHTRHGDLLDDLAPADGSFDLAAGDTLALAYETGAAAEASAAGWFLLFRHTATATAEQAGRVQQPAALPAALALAQNRPNPFAAVTRIQFDLPRESHVRLEVFDLLGRRVAVLADGAYPPGFHGVDWNRQSLAGGRVQPGVYGYRMQAGEFSAQRKLVLLP